MTEVIWNVEKQTLKKNAPASRWPRGELYRAAMATGPMTTQQERQLIRGQFLLQIRVYSHSFYETFTEKRIWKRKFLRFIIADRSIPNKIVWMALM